MSDFLQDAFEPFKISKRELEGIVCDMIKLWPEKTNCEEKEFGQNSYTCRSLVRQGMHVRNKFEDVDWGDKIDIAGIVMDFVGLAMKNSSKYLSVIRSNELDIEMIIADISSRDDIILTEN